ncbi:Arginine kinase [Hypsibius exemplaris]|uniref:arginine kinase n=1 Tax=Hypsibius exemplaris TaxID=2072580 RepID=A0A1W0WGU7_HYPEX|nr:Arginine kinase [Hypsibius exemplaris]
MLSILFAVKGLRDYGKDHYLLHRTDMAAALNAADKLKRTEGAVEVLQADAKGHSLLKKYLTKEIVEKLKNKQTSMGATLWDCIQSGVANLDSGVGIYAPDAESYNVFSDLFYPIINEYHIGFDLTKGAKHPAPDFGMDKLNFPNPDPEGKYIISTRVRCGRSLKGYPFNPLLTEPQYLEMEKSVQQALAGLTGEHAGKYYPLKGMTKDVQNQLIEDHFLFKEGDRFLQAAQACRFWPDGRGIFHNDNKTFLVWVNEEDHLRIISMQKGGDLLTIYKRLIQGVQQIEAKLPFSHDERLGFLTFCPTNLGTTIRASVHIKLPKISKNLDEFNKIAARYNLQVRGTAGEHSETVGGVYDVSNKRRMGLTEYDAVKEMYDGVVELIKLEAKSQ